MIRGGGEGDDRAEIKKKEKNQETIRIIGVVDTLRFFESLRNDAPLFRFVRGAISEKWSIRTASKRANIGKFGEWNFERREFGTEFVESKFEIIARDNFYPDYLDPIRKIVADFDCRDSSLRLVPVKESGKEEGEDEAENGY